MLLRKAFVLVLVSFCFTSFLSAQDALKQGVYYLSGSVAFSSTSDDEPQFGISDIKEFDLSPSFSYFVIDRLSIGTELVFSYIEEEFSHRTYKENNIFRYYGIGPGLRYYFPGGIVVPFIGVTASYRKNIWYSSQEANSVGIVGGVNYFLANNAAIEPFIAYSRSSANNPKQSSDSFFIGVRTNYFIIN